MFFVAVLPVHKLYFVRPIRPKDFKEYHKEHKTNKKGLDGGFYQMIITELRDFIKNTLVARYPDTYEEKFNQIWLMQVRIIWL